jgi:hypothetical protein
VKIILILTALVGLTACSTPKGFHGDRYASYQLNALLKGTAFNNEHHHVQVRYDADVTAASVAHAGGHFYIVMPGFNQQRYNGSMSAYEAAEYQAFLYVKDAILKEIEKCDYSY